MPKKHGILDGFIIDDIKRREKNKHENESPHVPPPPGGPEMPLYDPEAEKEWQKRKEDEQNPGGIIEIDLRK